MLNHIKITGKLVATGIFLSILFVLVLLTPGIVHAQYNGCAYHSYERCNGSYLYWYDSCGNQQDVAQYCQSGCYNNSCQNYNNNYNNYNNYNGCAYHSYERCLGNNLYWYDSCGNQQDLAQYCSNGCYGNSCQNYNQNYNNNYNNSCTGNYQERCVGNNLDWYDSCGNYQSFIQLCPNGCYNGSCASNGYNYNYNNYNNCTNHAYKLCMNNSIYWYDSCNNQQGLYYSCGSGQTCQNGQCAAYVIQPLPTPSQNNYVAHYKTACYSSSLYWYDSLGAITGLYKNCSDSNSCTTDACSGNKCSNTLKCDGSTCATGSSDYNAYCSETVSSASGQNHCGNGLCETTTGETYANCPADCKISPASGLSVSFFAKQNLNSDQWQKTIQANSNGQVYFMISVANSSTAQIDNVIVSANIPTEISSLGNLQINGVPFSGDVISGINIGSVAPTTTKSITFEGKTATISGVATTQAVATSNISGITQSDSVSISFNPAQAAAAVSNTQATSGFGGFLSRWYIWILVALVIIFLFIVVFRRLSSDA